MYSIHIYTDGKATPNPGIATAGFAAQLKRNNTTVKEFQGMLKLPGRNTNNDAEYTAAIAALDTITRCGELTPSSTDALIWYQSESVTLYTDSELMFTQNVKKNQLYTGRPRKRKLGDRAPKKNSSWAAKTYNMRLKMHRSNLGAKLYKLRTSWPRDLVISMCLVPRELNTEADLLTNIAMDRLRESEAFIHPGKITELETSTPHKFEEESNNASI